MITQKEIVSEINAFGLSSIGVGREPDLAKIKDLSLQDMLDAVRQVERDNEQAERDGRRTNTAYSTSIVPDDRLTAAVYTWLHFCAPGYHDAYDEDDAIVHLKIGNTIHGLVKWARSDP